MTPCPHPIIASVEALKPKWCRDVPVDGLGLGEPTFNRSLPCGLSGDVPVLDMVLCSTEQCLCACSVVVEASALFCWLISLNFFMCIFCRSATPVMECALRRCQRHVAPAGPSLLSLKRTYSPRRRSPSTTVLQYERRYIIAV